MPDRSLQDVRRKCVRLMKVDPPPQRALPSAGPSDARLFDQWMVARFSAEEVQAIFRLELEYGERALAEWFAEVAAEAGVTPSSAN